MGIVKTIGFDQDILRKADLAKAVGHPARLTILKYMIQNPSCICNDLVDVLPLAQSTISKHLSELKNVGLIQGTITGNKLCYCIQPDVWEELQSMFKDWHLPNNFNTKTCC